MDLKELSSGFERNNNNTNPNANIINIWLNLISKNIKNHKIKIFLKNP